MKGIRKTAGCLILCASLVALTACGGPANNDVIEVSDDIIKVTVKNESDSEIYGISADYYLNGELLGTQGVTPAESGKAFSKDESVIFEFDEINLGTKEIPEGESFGLVISVQPEEQGDSVPVAHYEWNAEYGNEYSFTLSGDKQNGFNLVGRLTGSYKMTRL